MWEPRRLTTLSASVACYRDGFIFLYLVYAYIVFHKIYVNKKFRDPKISDPFCSDSSYGKSIINFLWEVSLGTASLKLKHLSLPCREVLIQLALRLSQGSTACVSTAHSCPTEKYKWFYWRTWKYRSSTDVPKMWILYIWLKECLHVLRADDIREHIRKFLPLELECTHITVFF
jgi:hypothetical protein